MSFDISGPNEDYYDNPPSITLTVVDPLTYQTLPVATALSTPTLSYNKATFTMQCSMSSRVYWGLGIYPKTQTKQS